MCTSGDEGLSMATGVFSHRSLAIWRAAPLGFDPARGYSGHSTVAQPPAIISPGRPTACCGVVHSPADQRTGGEDGRDCVGVQGLAVGATDRHHAHGQAGGNKGSEAGGWSPWGSQHVMQTSTRRRSWTGTAGPTTSSGSWFHVLKRHVRRRDSLDRMARCWSD